MNSTPFFRHALAAIQRTAGIQSFIPYRVLAATLLSAGSALFGGERASAQTTGSITTLHTFYPFTDAHEGRVSVASLLQGSDGLYYGVTAEGGTNDSGTMFTISPSGDYHLLYSFSLNNAQGPTGALVQGGDGNFYGTTRGTYSPNGTDTTPYHFGSVFQITPAGVFTPLHIFADSTGDGANPAAGLVVGKDGAFYGTTQQGGTNGDGTIFKITNAGELTILHNFADVEGYAPAAALVVGSDGNFYGTCSYGGKYPDGNGSYRNGGGTIFKITPAGVFSVIYNFTLGSDGGVPRGGLTLDSDGSFFGTTYGTVYRVTPEGALTTLHTFPGDSGSTALAAPVLRGSDGIFYGTTTGDGGGDFGIVFQMTRAGVLTVLYRFTDGDANGYQSQAGLVQDSQGNLYGVTTQGGAPSDVAGRSGTVFKISLSSTPSTFFTGETALSNGVYYLAFPNGKPFGYYSYLTDSHYIYHFDLGYEYVFDANDGKDGVYLYDFTSNTFFYTSPNFSFPYLYDFSLNSILYYYPDPNNEGRYNTKGVRYFYEFRTGKIITK